MKEFFEKNNIKKLSKKLVNIALNSNEFKQQLKQDAYEITEKAKIAKNEATVEGFFERNID